MTSIQLHQMYVAFCRKGTTRDRRSRRGRWDRRKRIRAMTEPYSRKYGGIFAASNFIEIDDRVKPASNLLQWCLGYEYADRSVARDVVGKVGVSTVFLGLDYNYGHAPRPMLYETMVFGGTHDHHQRRYCTRAEAAAGHYETLRMVQGAELAS